MRIFSQLPKKLEKDDRIASMAGPPKRERFNAKARQSSVGGSSHKKRRRAKVIGDEDGTGNETIIDPTEQKAKAEEDARRRLVSA